ncbi:MAG: winged helix-turn-helix transcriptional regulator [Deltaproteobacteria bacterium]|nr:winged helix-turn-helix transcriptional regulator [Deltaproteobacteria bacterium]
MNEIMIRQAAVLKALAQPTRMQILELLRQGERCVCEIIPALQEEQSNLSKHLASLRHAGIVNLRKEGTSNYYSVRHPEVFRILDLARKIVENEVKRSANMLKGLKVKS